MKNFLILLLMISVFSCESEEAALDGMTLISGNSSKTWEVVSVAADEDADVEKCNADDIWHFTQEGWKYPDWILEISPGFLKCDIRESATRWNWKFNSDFTQLYLTSIDDQSYSDILKFDVKEISEKTLILMQTDEDTWGTDFTNYTITLNAR